MFKFFLKPNRILAAMLLLIVLSLFFIPIYSIDKHLMSILFMIYCFVAYQKVKKHGEAFYSERIARNSGLLWICLLWILSLLLLETQVRMNWYEQSKTIQYVLSGLGISYCTLFFYRVFSMK